MPISGLVIRLVCKDFAERTQTLDSLARIDGLELALDHVAGVAAVLDAPDYARHDAALSQVADTHGVCAIDVVSHEFSDVEQFDHLPRQKREMRR